MKSFKWSFPLITLFLFMATVLPISQTWGACTPPPADLVSWWSGNNHPFDLISLNNGTLTNGLTYTASGKVQQAFSFDGTDDALVMTTTALNGAYNQFTIDAWVFPTSRGNLKTIISKSNTDGFALRANGDGNLVFYMQTSGGSYNVTFSHATLLPLPLDTWTHVAIVYDGVTYNEIACFVNGALVGSVSASGTVSNTLNASTCLMIGNEPDVCNVQTEEGLDFSWAGRLDEIEFFNRALFLTEIQAIYNAGVDGKCLDLIPDTFTFTDIVGASLSTQYTSNTITVGGLAANAPISVTGGEYRIGAGSFTSALGTVTNGNTVTVQQTSAGTVSTATNTVLTIGTVSDTYSVTTLNATPTVTNITPSSGLNTGSVNITNLAGTGFLTGATVKLTRSGQADINATVVSVVTANQITCTFNLTGAAAGPWNVVVTNSDALSGTLTNGFTVNNPVPTITTLSPTSGLAGGAQFTLTVNGTNFVNGSTVQWNGSARTTTYVNTTQLTAIILVADIAAAGTIPVTVVNAAPGGGTSNAVNFQVNNPVPTITTLSPTSGLTGGPQFTLTVNGTNFVNGSTVQWNGNSRTTTYVSATQLTATILVGDIVAAGTFPVTVVNAAPGGGTSNVVNFQVNNPVPTVTTLSPTSGTAGGAQFTLTVNGTNFISTSTVQWNGTARTTTYVSSTQVTAVILAADIATGGTFPVTVVNSTPGGGTSNAVNFTVNNPVPTITTLSPTSATAGGAQFNLTVNGTNFVSTSTVQWNGNPRTTTYVSATQLTATILLGDIATGGTFPVTVANPTPGGGTSNAVNFTVNNPVPTVTTLSPNSATVGGVQFILTVNGTNFINGVSTVRWNGSSRTTTWVSATQVTAIILAGDIVAAGTFSVTVVNVGPGGGTSSPASFAVNNPVPTLTTLSPSSAAAGGPGFTLALNGTNFVNGSTVQWKGNPRTTTYVSATQLTANIPAGDIATVGLYPITVFNSAPGGGSSNSLNFNAFSYNLHLPLILKN
jgi:hypothetical protein